MGRGARKPQDQQPSCFDMASQSRGRSEPESLLPSPTDSTPLSSSRFGPETASEAGGRGAEEARESRKKSETGQAESAPVPPAAAFSALALPQPRDTGQDSHSPVRPWHRPPSSRKPSWLRGCLTPAPLFISASTRMNAVLRFCFHAHQTENSVEAKTTSSSSPNPDQCSIH